MPLARPTRHRSATSRRAGSTATACSTSSPPPQRRSTGVDTDKFSVTAGDGTALSATWYRRSTGEPPGSAVLYLHGGGMIFSLDHLGSMYELAARRYVSESGVPLLLVDYRVAPEHPHPTPVEDCYAALEWLAANADMLGFDPDRIAVMGDSAGGGLAAGVCLMARDRNGPAVAQQLLIYPMLDDRPAASAAAPLRHLTWTYDDNLTGWGALLGDDAGGERRLAVRGTGSRHRPGRVARHLHRRRRPRHLPRRGHRVRPQAVRRRSADRISSASRLPARIRSACRQCRRVQACHSTTASGGCFPCDHQARVTAHRRPSIAMTGVMACAQRHVAARQGNDQ